MSKAIKKYSNDINLEAHNETNVLTLQLTGSSSGSTTIQTAATTTSYTITLPGAVATLANQVLTSDTSGNLSWQSVSAIIAPTTPGLPLNSIQYNSSNTFAGSANLTYNGSVMYLNGYMGIQATPTAMLTLGNPVGSPQVAPLKFTVGTLLGTPQAGAIEYDGSELYVTDSTATRHSLVYTDTLFTYESGTFTIYIHQTTDATPGNDITGNGSAAYPYATILKALQTIPAITYGSVALQFGVGSWSIGLAECAEISKKKFYQPSGSPSGVGCLQLLGAPFALSETVSLTQGSNPFIYNVTGGTTPWSTNVHEGHFFQYSSAYIPIEGNTSNTVTVALPSTPSLTQIYTTTTTITFTVPVADFAPDDVNGYYSLEFKSLTISQSITSARFIMAQGGNRRTVYYILYCNIQQTGGNAPMLSFGGSGHLIIESFFKAYGITSQYGVTNQANYLVMSSCVFKNSISNGYTFLNQGGNMLMSNCISSNFAVCAPIQAFGNIMFSNFYFKGGTNVFEFLNSGTPSPGISNIACNNLCVDSGTNVLYFSQASNTNISVNIQAITGSYVLFNPTSVITNKYIAPNLGINIIVPGIYPEISNGQIATAAYNAVTNVAVGDKTQNRSITISYIMSRGTNFQQGHIEILECGLSAPLITDNYQNTADLGVTFDVAYDGTLTNQINLVCTANNQDSNATTIKYNVQRVMI